MVSREGPPHVVRIVRDEGLSHEAVEVLVGERERWLERTPSPRLMLFSGRSNPELASAMKKMQRSGALRDPNRAQAAMSQLTAPERRALIQVQEEQGVMAPEATNRQMRRKLDKAKRDAQRRR